MRFVPGVNVIGGFPTHHLSFITDLAALSADITDCRVRCSSVEVGGKKTLVQFLSFGVDVYKDVLQQVVNTVFLADYSIDPIPQHPSQVFPDPKDLNSIVFQINMGSPHWFGAELDFLKPHHENRNRFDPWTS